MAEAVRGVFLSTNRGGRLDNSNYASIADALMKQASAENFWGVSTSKLRSIYGYIMNVYTEVDDQNAFESHQGDISYLKVRMAYECGRDDKGVGKFIKHTGLMGLLDSVNSYDTFMLYCRYAESIVAYFKFYGGKD